MTPRSTASTALCEGFLWMGLTGRGGPDRSTFHPHYSSKPFNLPDAVDSANDTRIGGFPPFSQPYYYGFEDSHFSSYALSFLPAAPRTHP